MPSSQGEFTVQFETRTFWQQSMSMPSRFGVDLQFVDRKVVDAGGEYPEIAAVLRS